MISWINQRRAIQHPCVELAEDGALPCVGPLVGSSRPTVLRTLRRLRFEAMPIIEPLRSEAAVENVDQSPNERHRKLESVS